MPVIRSTYVAPPFLGGGHVQTLFASLIRRVRFQYDDRERIRTRDDDLLRLDWAVPQATRTASPNHAVILTHGLEGSTDRGYMRGMARALMRRGWAVCAWNLRGCGGSVNRQPTTYHSGQTEDLARVVNHVLGKGFATVGLVGFSLGGNLTLKYVGERGSDVDRRVRGAVAFSTPVDLQAASQRIAHWSNQHYTAYFLRSLREKIRAQAKRHPNRVRTDALHHIRTLRDFDDAYTAPLNGFYDADTYYRRASSKPLLADAAVPTLLVNAANDPFLPEACYPRDSAERQENLVLEVPESGGHVGFVSFDEEGEYWSERRAASFLARAFGAHRTRSAGP